MPCSTILRGYLKMETRVVHLTDESTLNALAMRRKGKTLRQLATDLGLAESAIATLSAVLHDRPSALSSASENDLRRRLGLPVIETRPVEVCPTCLVDGRREVHAAGDCHGVPVAQVVCLAPGASVKSARRPAEPWVAQAVTNLARLEQQRPVDTAPRVYNRAGQRVVFCL